MSKKIRQLTLAAFGTLIFSLGMNLFIVPLGFYSGGFLGVGQIIRTILVDYLQLPFGGIDIAGIVFYVINIPLFWLAYHSVGKKFFISSILCISVQTIFLTVIKSPIQPILDDPLTAAIVGGILAGYGGGLTLREGGSGGGQDILGIYMIKRKHNASVGKIAILINIVVYGICAVMFDIKIVIYSLIYVVVSSYVMDMMHTQNLSVSSIIISKNDDIVKDIAMQLNRTSTIIEGKGAYNGGECKVIYTVVSKYESYLLKEIVKKRDENAFVTLLDVRCVQGNFEKHLFD